LKLKEEGGRYLELAGWPKTIDTRESGREKGPTTRKTPTEKSRRGPLVNSMKGSGICRTILASARDSIKQWRT